MNSLSHQECGTDRGGGLYIYFRKIHLALETRTYQVFSCIYRILPLCSPSSHHDEGLSLEPGAFSWLAQKLSDCACLCSLMLESQAHRAMPGIQIRSFCLQSKCSYPPSQFPKCPFEGDYSRDGAMAVAVHVLQHRRRGHLLTEVMVCVRSEAVIAVNQGHK